MSAPLFSIIIPNWNGAIHLPTCLMALRAQFHAPLEVIVVDNASTDGSQALIRAEFPEVRLIELTANRGFTGACNAGLQAANGAFLALLNNDTEADPHWAAEVLACFARHPRQASWLPRCCYSISAMFSHCGRSLHSGRQSRQSWRVATRSRPV